MSILCLWNPDWRTGEGFPAELTALLLEEAPRVVVEGRGVVWVDARGLPAERLARGLLERLKEQRMEDVRAGISAVPVAAEVAARRGEERLEVVRPGEECAYLAPHALEALTEDEDLLGLLEGAGVCGCGDLAARTAEEVEVRFGAEGVRLWRLARGDDPRLLFRPIPSERPHASLDFVDYTIRDATRLLFPLNALLDQVCGILWRRARRARTLTLTFHLSGGGSTGEVLRTTRPTAERALWIRRLRDVLERIRLPDAISGIALEATGQEPISALQGDLFDQGFATAGYVEEAVGRLLDLYGGLFVRQASSRHPLAERRTRWIEVTPQELVETGHAREDAVGGATSLDGPEKGPLAGAHPALALRLLEKPRSITVRTRPRRDHHLPVRYREGKLWHDLTAAGPDRVSGGHEEERPYAREYFRCVSDQGTLLWIYRDAREEGWYLHGWWE